MSHATDASRTKEASTATVSVLYPRCSDLAVWLCTEQRVAFTRTTLQPAGMKQKHPGEENVAIVSTCTD